MISADYVAKVQGLEHIFKSINHGDSEHPPAIFHSVEYKEKFQLTGRHVMSLGVKKLAWT